MYKEISKYYNEIYESKNYTKESNIILSNCVKFGTPNNTLLDIGCGTGSHLKLLENEFITTGVDMSKEMIDVAKSNLSNTTLYVGRVEDISESNFDVIISMFNVVNHILTLNELILFFKTCSEKINKNGLLMFDMFNGNEVLLDPPKIKTHKNNGFTVHTIPNMDVSNSSLIMSNEIIKDGVSLFKYDLEHTLWPYKVYSDLLTMNGFTIVDVTVGYKSLITAIKK